MSEPALTEMRETHKLEEIETVELIEFGRTSEGWRLFLNGRELPFFTSAEVRPTVEIDPAGSGFDVLHLQLLVEPDAEIRRFNIDEPATKPWVQPGLL